MLHTDVMNPRVVGVNGTPLEEEATAESLLQSDAPVIVAMHGLSGGQQSSYIRHFVATAAREPPGWRVVVMVARGCDDLKLTTHEGFTATKYSDYGTIRSPLIVLYRAYICAGSDEA